MCQNRLKKNQDKVEDPVKTCDKSIREFILLVKGCEMSTCFLYIILVPLFEGGVTLTLFGKFW